MRTYQSVIYLRLVQYDQAFFLPLHGFLPFSTLTSFFSKVDVLVRAEAAFPSIFFMSFFTLAALFPFLVLVLIAVASFALALAAAAIFAASSCAFFARSFASDEAAYALSAIFFVTFTFLAALA